MFARRCKAVSHLRGGLLDCAGRFPDGEHRLLGGKNAFLAWGRRFLTARVDFPDVNDRFRSAWENFSDVKMCCAGVDAGCSNKPQHILHVIKADRLVFQPTGGPHGTGCEGEPGGGFVSEFDAFAIGREEDGVIAHHIATTERVHADFARLARTDVAESAMRHIVLIGGAGFFVENFQQAAGGAGWSVDLVFVVHLGDLDIEAVLSENAGGVTGEPEECVHADGVICSVNDANGFGGGVNDFPFRIGVTGGADDEVGAVFQGCRDQRGGEGMNGEVDGAGGLGNRSVQILARIMGGGDRDARLSGGGDDGLAHTAGFSSNEE